MKAFFFKTFFFFFLFFSVFTYAQDFQIRKIMVQGNYSFTHKEILNMIHIQEYQEVSAHSIQKLTQIIESQYRQKGYSLCEVTGWLTLERDLVIQIYEGMIEEVIFLKLNYYQLYLVRDVFGDYQNKVFYQPFIESQLKKVAKVLEISGFSYEILPHESKKGVFSLFISKKQAQKNQKKDPYTQIQFNFRGWFLSLVPYIDVDFYNMGGYDHSLRLSLDVRFQTLKWFSGSLGVVNEYYTLNYFSVPLYRQVRLNFQTGFLINRTGRGDLEVQFKTTKIPLQLGFGYDFPNFWASLRGGYLFEKLSKIQFQEDSESAIVYPEFTQRDEEHFAFFSLTLNKEEKRKYLLEYNDSFKLNIDYYTNALYSWAFAQFDAEKYFFYKADVFLFRFRALSLFGTYPVYYQPLLSDEKHLRGYGNLYSSHALDFTLEHWNMFYKNMWYSILFIDSGFFDNQTYNNSLSSKNFALSWGVGMGVSFQEINFRIYYALPMKQKGNKGKFDFFFRRRF